MQKYELLPHINSVQQRQTDNDSLDAQARGGHLGHN